MLVGVGCKQIAYTQKAPQRAKLRGCWCWLVGGLGLSLYFNEAVEHFAFQLLPDFDELFDVVE